MELSTKISAELPDALREATKLFAERHDGRRLDAIDHLISAEERREVRAE